jgi:hypothetical protein
MATAIALRIVEQPPWWNHNTGLSEQCHSALPTPIVDDAEKVKVDYELFPLDHRPASMERAYSRD